MTGTETSKSIQANMLWNSIGSLFYQGCMWLLTVLVVRLSTDYQNSGALAFAMSVGNVFYMLGTYNLRTYQVADTTGRYSPSNYVAIRIVTVVLALIICIPYSIIVSPSQSTLLVICAFLLFKADEVFVNVFYGVDQQNLRLDISGKSQIIRGVLCVALFTLGMLISDSLQISLLAMAAGCCSTTVLFDFPKTKQLVPSLAPHIPAAECKAVLARCLPSALGIVIANFVVSTARQLFGLEFGESALGIYASVATPCVVIQVLAQNVYTPLLGPISKIYREGQGNKARATALKLLAGTTLGALLISLFVFLLSEPLLTFVYGAEIASYVYLVPGVLAVTSLSALLTLLTDLLIVYGGLKSTLVMNALAFIAMLIAYKPMTSTFYMNGISLALCIAYICAIILGIILLLRRCKTEWPGEEEAA